MYEKGNVSIREEKKIPRMFHSRSHFVKKNLWRQEKAWHTQTLLYVLKLKNLTTSRNSPPLQISSYMCESNHVLALLIFYATGHQSSP